MGVFFAEDAAGVFLCDGAGVFGFFGDGFFAEEAAVDSRARFEGVFDLLCGSAAAAG